MIARPFIDHPPHRPFTPPRVRTTWLRSPNLGSLLVCLIAGGTACKSDPVDSGADSDGGTGAQTDGDGSAGSGDSTGGGSGSGRTDGGGSGDGTSGGGSTAGSGPGSGSSGSGDGDGDGFSIVAPPDVGDDFMCDPGKQNCPGEHLKCTPYVRDNPDPFVDAAHCVEIIGTNGLDEPCVRMDHNDDCDRGFFCMTESSGTEGNGTCIQLCDVSSDMCPQGMQCESHNDGILPFCV